MSREIKFRIWDSNSQQMSIETVGPKDWGDYLVDFKDGAVDIAADYAVWLQYTGLKDKNGVEIYEGDILSYLRCPQRHTGCTCEKKPDPDFTDVVIWEAPEFTCRELSNSWDGYEVIGNIYENPDLLESRS